MPRPEAGESRQGFVSRCTDELLDSGEFDDPDEAENECSLIWERERRGGMKPIIHKASPGKAEGFVFTMSDETPDRMHDIILASSWQLDNFKRTGSICLFNHNRDWVVGSWTDVKVENGALKGRLVLAPPGTSTKSDEVARLISAGILKSCSVGFRALQSRPRTVNGEIKGTVFELAELVECSICSVPANPAAVLASKSLGVSDATQRLIFTEQSDGAQRERTKRARELRLRSYSLLNDPAYFRYLRKRDPAGAADLERRIREFGLTPRLK
jgi:HK97 family phage prohead protease